MKISASLVSYRSREHIDACLSALRRQAEVAEILIVDSGSDDGTVEYLRERHPELEVDALAENIGYAAGHNRNFARARGDAFLVLNPDVALDTDCVARLAAALEAQPNIASVGPKLLSADAPSLIDSAGIECDRTRGRFRDRGRGAPASHFRQREEIFGVCGAAALYRKNALVEVSRSGCSPFAESFFMYYEDVDLAWRLRRAGWRNVFVPSATARHQRGGAGAREAFVEYHLVRNRLWLSARNASVGEFLREAPGLLFFGAAKCLQATRRPHLRRALLDQWRGLPRAFAERNAGTAP